jgi:hypothetical protein
MDAKTSGSKGLQSWTSGASCFSSNHDETEPCELTTRQKTTAQARARQGKTRDGMARQRKARVGIRVKVKVRVRVRVKQYQIR